MVRKNSFAPTSDPIGRRAFLAAAAVAAVAPAGLSQSTSYGQEAPPVRYPDPGIVLLDDRFARYRISNTPIERLYTGMLWAEGPAWNGVGNYLVWSDIPNDVQHRWLAEDGHVSVFRRPSNYSNGNAFDREGRQLSCEHGARRVVRYEHNGAVSVLADQYRGKPFNAPNDLVVHPDGGIWFTDPGYGSMGDYEGHKGELQLKEAVYRIDGRTGEIEKVIDELAKPNGLCFSPDFTKLYVSDTGSRPAQIHVWQVVEGKKLAGGRDFVSMKLTIKGREINGGGDGIRADLDGNIWIGAWGGEGFDGVHIVAPDGVRMGQIMLPEGASNVCFGGPKRNRLFITASRSLYAVYVGTRGAPLA